MMNTENEQGELIRLQRQELEDKLKEDKENKIKKEAKEKEEKEQHDKDMISGVALRGPLTGNGGSNDLREVRNTINYLMFNQGKQGEYIMPDHNPKLPAAPTNAYVDPNVDEEEEEGL